MVRNKLEFSLFQLESKCGITERKTKGLYEIKTSAQPIHQRHIIYRQAGSDHGQNT